MSAHDMNATVPVRDFLRMREERDRAFAERDEALEALKQIKDTACPSASLPGAWLLTEAEERLVLLIASRAVLARRDAHVIFYGERPEYDQPDPKVFDAWVCKIRTKLAPYGISVDSVWGTGWSMDADSRIRVAAARDAVARGELSAGREHDVVSPVGNPKLSDDAVRDIRAMAAKGHRGRDIAKLYNVGSATVRNIICHRSWRHVQ